jgi:uncharacterized protein (UPF0210 family)
MDTNILNNIFIKYPKELEDYTHIEKDKIEIIPHGCFIVYISKKNLVKKGGFLKRVINEDIVELINMYKKRKWFIYTKDYVLFYKIPDYNQFKKTLLNMVKTNFSNEKELINNSKIKIIKMDSAENT